MNQTVNVRGGVTDNEARQQLKQQLTLYMEQQPESMKAVHKWMKGLEVASLVLIINAFIVALYFSIYYKNVQQIWIPITWFLFAASASPTLILIGIHSLILRVYPAFVFSGLGQKFMTGRGAIWTGWGYIVGGLALAAFWGLFAYATWAQNWTLLTPLISFLGVAMGIMIVVGMLLATIQKLIKSR